MERHLPGEVRNQLEILREAKLETPDMLVFLEKVLELLLAKEMDDFISGCCLCYREEECISIEWPKKSIFCSFFSDLVEIDRVYTIAKGDYTHDSREISYSSLDSNFLREFESIWAADALRLS
jgi:hypothetical protein